MTDSQVHNTQSPADGAAAAFPACHRDIIDLWPCLADYATDIGVPYNTAKHMRRRNSIGDAHRTATIEAANRRQISGITFELLTRTAPQRRSAAA